MLYRLSRIPVIEVRLESKRDLLQEVSQAARPVLAEPHAVASPVPLSADLQLAISAMSGTHGKALFGVNGPKQAHLPAIAGSSASDLFASLSGSDRSALGGKPAHNGPVAGSPASDLFARLSGSDRSALGGKAVHNGPMASLGIPPFAMDSVGSGRGSLTRSLPLSGCDLSGPGLDSHLPGQLPFSSKVLSWTSNGGGDFSCYNAGAPAAAAGAPRRSTSSIATDMSADPMAGLTAGMVPAGGGGQGVVPGSWLDSTRERESNINFASIGRPAKSDASMGTFIGEVMMQSNYVIVRY